MKQKHNYYKLDKREISFGSVVRGILKIPISLPQWIASFFLARTLTNIALNHSQIKKQRPIHVVNMSDEENKNEHVIINLLPHEPYKKLKDFLLKASTIIPLPFVTKFKTSNLSFDNPEDKEHIDKILDEIDLPLQGNSKVDRCEDKLFPWDKIHFKGLEKLDLKLRGYFLEELEKRYGKEIFSTERSPKLNFFTLETEDGAVLDSVEVMPPAEELKPIEERKFVIACLARDQNYINWLKDFSYSAQNIGCTVIGFNYRGVCYSRGMVWTQKNLVEDAIAQAQRLIALGAKPENIGFEGMCIGGAVATLTAAELHDRNVPVKLYNYSSFRSILRMITGYILPEGKINYYNPLTYIRYLTVALTYALIAPIIWLAGWHMDAASAWDRIPFSAKNYSVIRPSNPETNVQEPTDGVIHDTWASMASYIDETRAALISKQIHGEPLNDEELEIVDDSPGQHYFHPSQSADLHGKAAHFLPRRYLVQDSDPEAAEGNPQQRSNHSHMISSFRRKFGLDNPSLPIIKMAGTTDSFGTKRPLVLAVSGGIGHINAAKAILSDLEKKHPVTLQKTEYETPLYRNKHFTLERMLIRIGVWASSIAYLGAIVRALTRLLGFPALPSHSAYWHELNKLESSELELNNEQGGEPVLRGRKREYVDMLLDIYPTGYEYAAINNSLHLQSKLDDLRLLIKSKEVAERTHHAIVYEQTLGMLIRAAERGHPYTELLSTQPLSLGALCDAVRFYNEHYVAKRNRNHVPPLPTIDIHQYMTDLPSIDCTHFFESLGELSTDQKQYMHIHAVSLSEAIIEAHLKGFKGVHNILPHENPMVRAGFKNPDLVKYLDRKSTHYFAVNAYTKVGEQYTLNSEHEIIEVSPGAKVASIMIGSLASSASLDYLKIFLDKGYDKIFVFGGLNDELFTALQSLINTYPAERQAEISKRIVRLGNQGDKEMAPIMTRSDTVVIRGGGLSVMEQMALPLLPKKTVLLHHSDCGDKPLSSGVSWEDGNANKLIEFLSARNVFARKTSPQRCELDIQEAEEGRRRTNPLSRLIAKRDGPKASVGQNSAPHSAPLNTQLRRSFSSPSIKGFVDNSLFPAQEMITNCNQTQSTTVHNNRPT